MRFRPRLLVCTILLSSGFFAACAQPAPLPSADEVMAQATSRAAAEHKKILLVFSASWCGPCKMFEGFLEDPSIRPIIDRTFVVARLDVGEHAGDKRHSDSPGGEKLRASLEGSEPSYPFIAMLDASGKPIVNSMRPDAHSKGGENIGYPSLPVEVDWFMQMLQQAAPGLSPQDTKTVRAWLHERGSKSPGA